MSYTELSLKEVVCRKEHRCEWCNEKIEIKSKAMKRVYIFEDDFNSNYDHFECFEAMEESFNEHGFNGEFETGGQDRGKTYNESHN